MCDFKSSYLILLIFDRILKYFVYFTQITSSPVVITQDGTLHYIQICLISTDISSLFKVRAYTLGQIGHSIPSCRLLLIVKITCASPCFVWEWIQQRGALWLLKISLVKKMYICNWKWFVSRRTRDSVVSASWIMCERESSRHTPPYGSEGFQKKEWLTLQDATVKLFYGDKW